MTTALQTFVWSVNIKGQSNLAKGNIAQLIMTSGIVHCCLVDIFYHIRQVAACFTKLVWGCIQGSKVFGKGEVTGVSNDTTRKSDGGFL